MKLLLAFYLVSATAPALGEDALELLTAKDERGNFVIEEEMRTSFAAMPDSVHRRFDKGVESGMISDPEQVRNLLALRLTADKLAYLLTDNCILCHSNPAEQEPETLLSLDPKERGSPPHLHLRAAVNDVHFQRGLSCSGCHGGQPTDLEMVDEIYERWPDPDERIEDRAWIPEFCGGCHAKPAFIRRFNPELPTDQLAKFRTSHHGSSLLEEGDSKAAQCVSCHTAHAVYPAENPASSVHPKRVPTTCGRCHADAEYMTGYETTSGNPMPTNQVAEYEDSVHGKALFLKNDLTAPVCNDCHGNHAAMPPKVSDVAQVCRLCHVSQGNLFDESTHKTAFRKENWPECEKCHGKHAIGKLTADVVGDAPGDLCYECHAEYAKDNTECNFVSAHFGKTLRFLAEEHERYSARAHNLAEKGLDVEPLEESLTSLSDALIQSRTALHAFELVPFNQSARPGIEAAKQAGAQVAEAEDEYTYRQAGLTIAMILTLLFALALYLKLRAVEKSG